MTHGLPSSDPIEAPLRRIAVLLANNDDSDFSRQFPNDGEKVCSLLRARRPDWAYTIYSVKDGEFPEIDAADGFIITGSPASVHDPLPWIAALEALIRELNKRRVPLVGLCFGHQLIATALGGQVSRNPGGWRFGIATTLYPTGGMSARPGVYQLRLHACHSEQVTRLPPGAEWLGGDIFCPNASFAMGSHIVTTQYHPEFTHAFMVALAAVYRGEVPDRVLEVGRQQLEGDVDASQFAEWAARLLTGGLLRPSAEQPSVF